MLMKRNTQLKIRKINIVDVKSTSIESGKLNSELREDEAL